jgi:8-oxo-dGTP diphosphatase
VGALIFRGRSKTGPILLVERGGQPLKGYWSLPGGLVETGESLDAAVRREVLEETGLKVKPVEMFGVFERLMKDTRGRTEYHYLLVDYVCTVTGGKLQAADDVARVKWVPREHLGDYRMTEGTREVIEKAYAGAGKKHT